MVNLLSSNINFIIENSLIEKQFAEIKESGKDEQYHFVVKGNRFAIIQKSDWLLGRIWFQFQVLLGWIKTCEFSKESIRAEIKRLKQDDEINEFFTKYVNPGFTDFENQKNRIQELVKEVQENYYAGLPDDIESQALSLLAGYEEESSSNEIEEIITLHALKMVASEENVT